VPWPRWSAAGTGFFIRATVIRIMGLGDEIKERSLIEESISVSDVKGLVDLIEAYYLKPKLEVSKIAEYSKSGPGNDSAFDLYWRIKEPEKPGEPEPRPVAVHLSVSQTGVTIAFPGMNLDDVQASRISDRAADDVEFLSTSFIARAKRKDIRFVYSPGEEREEAPSKSAESFSDEVLKRIFSGNAANLFLTFLLVAFVLTIFLGDYTVIAIFCMQAIILLFSDRIILSVGKVNPVEKRPEVTIVRVESTPQVGKDAARISNALLRPVREALGAALAERTPADAEAKNRIHDTLVKSGVPCDPDDIEITTRNPYRLVNAAAEKFHLPVPKIAVVNTPMDNASATGFAPSRSTMTITAGALEDLNDEELNAVVGHELGHVRGHDTVILFVVTCLIYLGGFYLWLPLLLYLGIFYFLIAFGITYMVGKFLETRADTLSAVVLGTPDALASALTKIGFTQLYLERYHQGYRLLDWLRFDSHPPIYFRIQRLTRISHDGVKVKHAFWTSVRDCLSGFLGLFVPGNRTP